MTPPLPKGFKARDRGSAPHAVIIGSGFGGLAAAARAVERPSAEGASC